MGWFRLRRVKTQLPSRQKVIEALNKMQELDLGGFFIKFDLLTQNGSKFTELTVVAEDGRLER